MALRHDQNARCRARMADMIVNAGSALGTVVTPLRDRRAGPQNIYNEDRATSEKDDAALPADESFGRCPYNPCSRRTLVAAASPTKGGSKPCANSG